MTDTAIQVLLELSQQPATAADIADKIGKPVKTCSMTLSRLLARGRVTVIGKIQPERGRPARVYEVRRP